MGFDADTMNTILLETVNQIDAVIKTVIAQIPHDFPIYIRDSILDGLTESAKRITPESVIQTKM